MATHYVLTSSDYVYTENYPPLGYAQAEKDDFVIVHTENGSFDHSNVEAEEEKVAPTTSSVKSSWANRVKASAETKPATITKQAQSGASKS